MTLRRLKARGPYWTIVDQSNLHHGLEYSVPDFLGRITLLDFGVEAFIQASGLIAVQRSMEIRLIALLGAGKQCELRNYISPSDTVDPR